LSFLILSGVAGPWGKRCIRTKWERVELEVQEEAWKRKSGDLTCRGGEGTLRSRQRGNFCRRNEKERIYRVGGTEGLRGPDGRRQPSRLSRSGGFSLQTGAHGQGRPHLPVGRRKTEGEEDSYFPGRPHSRPQRWPSCLSAERKPQFPPSPAVASLGQPWLRLYGPELLGPEVRIRGTSGSRCGGTLTWRQP